MQLPIQITLCDMPQSKALESLIHEKAQKLDQFYDHIMGCHIVVKLAQNNQHQGKLYNIRIEITVPPSKRLAVTHNRDEDLYIALREAFDDARRQLEEHAARQHGNERYYHAKVPLHGRIARIFHAKRYGFIEAEDGHEVYFNDQISTTPKFDKLTAGTPVYFLEEMGEKGPQACRVRKISDDKL